MSFEHGSTNYQIAVSDGWVEGDARYSDEVPHHGPEYSYTNMHHAHRERALCLVIDGEYDGETYSFESHGQIRVNVALISEWPKTTDDWAADYYRAEVEDTEKLFLARSRGGVLDTVRLTPGDAYEIFSLGFDGDGVHVVDSGAVWRSYPYDGTLSRG